jgi:hypothetical protein
MAGLRNLLLGFAENIDHYRTNWQKEEKIDVLRSFEDLKQAFLKKCERLNNSTIQCGYRNIWR